jgi:hypothetical protein
VIFISPVVSRRRFARSGCLAPNGVSIEAVIWDFGGALTTSPFEAFNRYEVQRGRPRDLIRTFNAPNSIDVKLDAIRPRTQAERAFCGLWVHPYPPRADITRVSE